MSSQPPPPEKSSPPTSVITVFEAYGSGAATIGALVADHLGLPLHEQAFSSEQLEAQEAKREQEGVLTRVLQAIGTYGGRDGLDVVFDQRDTAQLIADNDRAVLGFASQGGVVIGRNGALILADHPGALHVRLDGPVDRRAERAAREADIPVDRARRRQVREDELRAQMSQRLYGWDPREVDHYDLVLNTSRLSGPTAVAIIAAALQAKLAGSTR